MSRTFHFVKFPSVTPSMLYFCLRFWGQKTFVIRLERKFRPKIFFLFSSKEKNFERRHLLLISDQQQLLSTTYLGKCIRRLVDSLFHVCCCRADRHSRFFFWCFTFENCFVHCGEREFFTPKVYHDRVFYSKASAICWEEESLACNSSHYSTFSERTWEMSSNFTFRSGRFDYSH